MTLRPSMPRGQLVLSNTFYSVGGGFVVERTPREGQPGAGAARAALPVHHGAELLQLCTRTA